MYENDSELDELQALLDESLQRSSAHLRSIFLPNRTIDARQLADVLTGMCVVSVATVTAKGEPRISALDGHFWHGRWVFGTARDSPKARQLAARPAISVSHVRGEQLGVFSHGTAEQVFPGEHPDWPELAARLTDFYGGPPGGADEIVYYRMRPHWMVAYASDPAKLVDPG